MPPRGRALEFGSLKQEILTQITPIFITFKTTTFIARLLAAELGRNLEGARTSLRFLVRRYVMLWP